MLSRSAPRPVDLVQLQLSRPLCPLLAVTFTTISLSSGWCLTKNNLNKLGCRVGRAARELLRTRTDTRTLCQPESLAHEEWAGSRGQPSPAMRRRQTSAPRRRACVFQTFQRRGAPAHVPTFSRPERAPHSTHLRGAPAKALALLSTPPSRSFTTAIPSLATCAVACTHHDHAWRRTSSVLNVSRARRCTSWERAGKSRPKELAQLLL